MYINFWWCVCPLQGLTREKKLKVFTDLRITVLLTVNVYVSATIRMKTGICIIHTHSNKRKTH